MQIVSDDITVTRYAMKFVCTLVKTAWLEKIK